ncbi:flagellar hook protein [Methylobacterium currus]|uniref:flagellin N-terminal helical domain-containing protein n=1 Tax=Methylobacterium currus TaxID=2051553 RepID=UPI001E371622|nr:flagellin [Methylobacterium currus]UHC18671.1 flagellar hook protein [Methylobacterium currus]
MSSGITLSAATRQNLLSLQDTAALLSTTQTRLSTGKKVNTALDGPVNYFTAQGLTSRSSALNNLLDGVSNGIQTIQAANTGLTKLRGLTDQLKSVAQQALSASNAFTAKAAIPSTALPGATANNLLSVGPTTAVGELAIGDAYKTTGSAIADNTAALDGALGLSGSGSTVTLNIDGHAITLNQGSDTASAMTVVDKLNASLAAAGSTARVSYSGSFSVVGGTQGTPGTPVALDANAQLLFGNTPTAVSAAAPQTATSVPLATAGAITSAVFGTDAKATFTIDGVAITLTSGIDDADGGASLSKSINNQLKAAGSAVTTKFDTTTNQLTITGTNDGGKFALGTEPAIGRLFGAAGATSTSGAFVPTATTLATGLGYVAGDTFTVNGQAVTVGRTDTVSSLAQKMSAATNGTVSASYDVTNKKFSFTAADSATGIVLGDGSTSTAKVSNLGFSAITNYGAGQGTTTADTSGVVPTQKFTKSKLDGQTITVRVGDGNFVSLTFGTVAGQISTLNQLNAALAPANAMATIDSTTGAIKVSTTNEAGADNLLLTATGTGNPFSSSTSSAIIGGDGANTRNGLVNTYNNLLNQIDQMAADAGFNGTNLLAGDTINVTFNERATSSLKVSGTAVTAAGLYLTPIEQVDFQDSNSINAVIKKINSANSALQSQASSLGANLAVVQNRQDFTKQMINVLDTGAANLTNADLNEEAANSQALSTRNSLGISALSLANQAQQGILQLLR